MNRQRALLVGLLGVALATGATAWLLWPRTAVTRENAPKVRVGMPLAEVEAILGGPARDEATGPVTWTGTVIAPTMWNCGPPLMSTCCWFRSVQNGSPTR
jgi:hypothetical protein